MTTAPLTAKGQITIPAEVPKDLKVDAGDRVEFVRIAPGRYELVAATQEVTELKGMFGPAKKTVSIQAMRLFESLDPENPGYISRCIDSGTLFGAHGELGMRSLYTPRYPANCALAATSLAAPSSTTWPFCSTMARSAWASTLR
jgi:antitoxin PrlF